MHVFLQHLLKLYRKGQGKADGCLGTKLNDKQIQAVWKASWAILDLVMSMTQRPKLNDSR